MNSNYEFDLAISFLSEDESIAYQIYSELSKDFKIFFYPTSQKEIVAKDGIDTFSSAFKEKSRANLVLYRSNWGSTNWTRIEETAIKSRIFEGDKYDSLFLIKLDSSDNPHWIPETYIYAEFNKYKFDELISAIKFRIQQRGGVPTEETLIEIAERAKQERKLNEEIGLFLSGKSGIEQAEIEMRKLLKILRQKHVELQNASIEIALSDLKENNLRASYQLWKIHLNFVWNQRYSNSIDGSFLEIILYPYSNGNGKSFLYNFSMNKLKQIGWVEVDGSDFFTSENLIDYWMKEHLRLVLEKRS